ncbi:MAG: enoyl-CoA hydratase-related protein, partial [Pseudomonadota bacterium]
MKSFKTTLNDQGILTISIDVANETMNVLNQQVIDDFELLSSDIEKNDAIKAVIFISGKQQGFIAGADIKILQQANTAMDGKTIAVNAHTLFGRIANSRKPHIAAIDGVCLGAGYELALACHYRIATDNKDTKIGLPEVMLGLLPGGMGNTKLPRLISLTAALDMLLSGKKVDSKRAMRMGMIDEVVSPNILQYSAESTALRLIEQGTPRRSSSFKDKLMKLSFIRKLIIKKAREQVMQKTQGLYPAPLAILDVVEQGLHKPLNKALEIEATQFGELTASPEAKQLINIYFATTELKKETFIDTDETPQAVTRLGI